MKNVLLIVLFKLALTSVNAAGNPDAIVGIWANSSNKGHIEIYKHQGKYFGKLIWLKNPFDKTTGKPKVDKNNPDAAQRNNELMGLVLLRDFNYDDNEWKGGKIYNPEDGKEYKAYLKLKDAKTLHCRGYIGFSLLGKTEIFTRVR